MNKKNKQKRLQKGSLAISQILILVIGIIAISYAVGSSVGVVSAGDINYGLDSKCGYDGIDCGKCSRCCDGKGKENYCSKQNYNCGGQPISGCAEEEKVNDLSTTDKPITDLDIVYMLLAEGAKEGIREMVSEVKKLIKGEKTLAEAVAEVTGKAGVEETIKKDPTKLQKFLQRYLWGKGETPEQIAQDSLKAGTFTAIIIVTYTFISVGLKT